MPYEYLWADMHANPHHHQIGQLEQWYRHARQVMDFLERKADVVRLLGQKPGRVTILIGRECGRPELADCSVVIGRYSVDGQDAGALGVIGPVRMDYPKLTALTQYLAQRVGSMLTVLMKEE